MIDKDRNKTFCYFYLLDRYSRTTLMQLNSASSPCTLPLHFSTQNSTGAFSSRKPPIKLSPFTSHPSPRRRSKFKTLPKPFLEEDVFPSSLPLHTKNPHAICDTIQRFARQDKLKEALTILDYVDHKGIPVNATTFSALIAACIRTKSLSEGKQIHTHIRVNGLEDNEFLKTKLIHMYTSCSSFKDARQVFDTLPVKGVYPYNALLRGSVVSGKRRYGDVVDTFMEMRELGVECNEYSFSCLIKSFAGASALRQGLKTHALLIKNGFIDSCMLLTSLIDMYFKCGKIALACKVFEEMDEKDVVVWGAMLAGFAHNRLQREALDYFRWMIAEGFCPNSVILTTILPVIGDIRAGKLGKEVHAYVLKTKSYIKQLTIQSALIDMYCKCGNMGSGRRVFYGSPERNAISWTALMSGYITNGKLEQALRCTVWMQQEGFRPDAVTIATVLPVCSELRALKHGKEIHAYALKNDMLPNISILTCLMVMYSKCRFVDYSFRLFECMSYRNVIAWTAMIDSYAENGRLCEAIGVFRAMQLSKHRPDSVAVARILNVCAKLKALKLGKEIHGYILKKNFESIMLVCSEIMKMYGSCQDIWSAKKVFNSLPMKGLVTWTAIIDAYGNSNMNRDAIDLFYKMISHGFSPNDYTFSIVLDICNKAGFQHEAYQISKMRSRSLKIVNV